MAKTVTKQLGESIPDHIRYLASLIARKPPKYTDEWAATVDEAFDRYTNTRTINLLHSINEMLIHVEWPFPAYLDLRHELKRGFRDVGLLASRLRWLAIPFLAFRGPSLGIIVLNLGGRSEEEERASADIALSYVFKRHRRSVFEYWSKHSLLRDKQGIVADLRATFERKLWAATVTTALPLLDHVARAYFGTDKFEASIQALRDAFVLKAGLKPKDLKPGYAVWDGQKDPESGNSVAKSLEEDLRLPGILLASFFEFADKYYGFYKSSMATSRTLNRHAIIHGAAECWTEANAVKLLTFLDLTLRLERPLRILIRGPQCDESRADA